MFAYEQFYQQQTDVIGRLRQAVEGLFRVVDIRTSTRGDAVMFVGQLVHDAESDYGALRERFRPLGYTPILRREGNSDIVVAQRGIVGAARFNPLINVVLLVATIFTTLFAAAIRAMTATDDISRLGSVLLAGAPFAITLLFILGVHEMGHYVAARIHG